MGGGCRYAEPIYPTLGAQFLGGVDRKYQSRIRTGAFLAHRKMDDLDMFISHKDC